ncbi:hypothetical protein HAX54_000261, partial [Datura stramonium]|nr:hypothetical protein [Datura stramonium]
VGWALAPSGRTLRMCFMQEAVPHRARCSTEMFAPRASYCTTTACLVPLITQVCDCIASSFDLCSFQLLHI